MTFAVRRELDDIRIGGQEIGRAHRLDELAREEAQSMLFLLVEIERLDEVDAVARVQQIALLQQTIGRIVPPFRGVEPAIAACRLNASFALHAGGRFDDVLGELV
ncbi:UNVERIFIED_ORG: hypothetical protein J2R84_005847 [Bradyrhizobium japonicum]